MRDSFAEHGALCVLGVRVQREPVGRKHREVNQVRLGDGAPRGTGRVWRREAFADTEGYMLTKSPDSVSDVMALLRGWKITRLSNVRCYQTRDTGGKTGLWNGYFNRGERTHYLNQNPLIVFNSIIVMLFISRQKNAIIKSLAFLCGYCKSLLKREEQIENDEPKKLVTQSDLVGHLANYI